MRIFLMKMSKKKFILFSLELLSILVQISIEIVVSFDYYTHKPPLYSNVKLKYKNELQKRTTKKNTN